MRSFSEFIEKNPNNLTKKGKIMPGFINEYIKGWNEALKDTSFREFTSFLLPLVAIPLAIKGVKMAGEYIKKKIDEKKAI